MYSKKLCPLVVCIAAVLHIVSLGGATEAPPPYESFAAQFGVVAQVRVLSIDHTLRASDVRRVDHGAPPPLIPYKVRLQVIRTHPKVELYRFTLEGITNSTWMPTPNDTGIIVLERAGQNYEPAATFPGSSFLVEQSKDGHQAVEFPPQSGCLLAYGRVWECLCDLLDARSDGLTEEQNTKWNHTLTKGRIEEIPMALFFLLNAPGTDIPWESLFNRLTMPADGNGQSPPWEPVLQVLGAYASGKNASDAVGLIRDLAAARSGRTHDFARVAMQVAARSPETSRVNLYSDLFSHEYDTRKGREGLITDFESLEPVLPLLANEEGRQLLARMLHEPARYPALRTAKSLEAFWIFLSKNQSEALLPYLEAFIATPTRETLGLQLEDAALIQLEALARALLADTKAPGTP